MTSLDFSQLLQYLPSIDELPDWARTLAVVANLLAAAGVLAVVSYKTVRGTVRGLIRVCRGLASVVRKALPTRRAEDPNFARLVSLLDPGTCTYDPVTRRLRAGDVTVLLDAAESPGLLKVLLGNYDMLPDLDVRERRVLTRACDGVVKEVVERDRNDRRKLVTCANVPAPTVVLHSAASVSGGKESGTPRDAYEQAQEAAYPVSWVGPPPVQPLASQSPSGSVVVPNVLGSNAATEKSDKQDPRKTRKN